MTTYYGFFIYYDAGVTVYIPDEQDGLQDAYEKIGNDVYDELIKIEYAQIQDIANPTAIFESERILIDTDARLAMNEIKQSKQIPPE